MTFHRIRLPVEKEPFRTYSEVGVDAGISCRPREVFVFLVGDVLVRSCVPVLLGESKVDGVDEVALLAETHEEVVGFDVSVDEVLRMDVLDATDLRRDKVLGDGQVLKFKYSILPCPCEFQFT